MEANGIVVNQASMARKTDAARGVDPRCQPRPFALPAGGDAGVLFQSYNRRRWRCASHRCNGMRYDCEREASTCCDPTDHTSFHVPILSVRESSSPARSFRCRPSFPFATSCPHRVDGVSARPGDRDRPRIRPPSEVETLPDASRMKVSDCRRPDRSRENSRTVDGGVGDPPPC